MKCLRTITKAQPVTFDRKLAEDHANIAVLGQNAVQQSAKLASHGAYTEARMYNLQNKKLLTRAAQTEEQQSQFSKWVSHGHKFEQEMGKAQQTELDNGMNLDDEEAFDAKDAKESKPAKKVSFDKKSKARKNNRTDSTANMLYQMKSTSSNAFK